MKLLTGIFWTVMVLAGCSSPPATDGGVERHLTLAGAQVGEPCNSAAQGASETVGANDALGCWTRESSTPSEAMRIYTDELAVLGAGIELSSVECSGLEFHVLEDYDTICIASLTLTSNPGEGFVAVSTVSDARVREMVEYAADAIDNQVVDRERSAHFGSSQVSLSVWPVLP